MEVKTKTIVELDEEEKKTINIAHDYIVEYCNYFDRCDEGCPFKSICNKLNKDTEFQNIPNLFGIITGTLTPYQEEGEN